jgi:hypothetical protein
VQLDAANDDRDHVIRPDERLRVATAIQWSEAL